MVDGEIEWFRVMLLYGIPYAFPYLLLYVPRWGGISGGIGALALEVIIAAVFGAVIAAAAFIKAVAYLIAAPLQTVISKRQRI